MFTFREVLVTLFFSFLLLTDASSTEIYTLSLHDALPILAKLGFIDFAGSSAVHSVGGWFSLAAVLIIGPRLGRFGKDRKSTRLNSSHVSISYAVFCLKKKTNKRKYPRHLSRCTMLTLRAH